MLENIMFMLAMTFDPRKGEGWTEAFLAVMFTITFCIMIIFNKEIPQILLGLMGIVLGFYFGNQNTKYSKV